MISQSKLLNELSLPFDIKGSYKNFPLLIEEFARIYEERIRNDIREYLEEMDRSFRYSKDRIKKYYVKDTIKRTIITMYGEISYLRTIYTSRIDNSRYCYVDDKLGIEKHSRYANDVACYVYEAYADENSMIKVGNEVGNLIYSKFSLTDNRAHSIPRQTIFNLIKRVKELRVISKEDKRKVKDLYILLDEKYISQNHKGKNEAFKNNLMAKSALFVEGLDTSNPKRHQYTEPYYYSIFYEYMEEGLMDVINNRYDTEYLKNINVLGDGAAWIKRVGDRDLKYPGVKTKFIIDKFHVFEYLWRIAKNKDTYSILVSYIYANDYESLETTLNALKNESNERQIKYILSNYRFIKRIIKLKNMNCAMEQVISHHIASQFTSVPKAYSKNNLNRYLSIRDNYRNKENLKEIFLEGLNDKDSESDKTTINKENLNFSMFESNSDKENHYGSRYDFYQNYFHNKKVYSY